MLLCPATVQNTTLSIRRYAYLPHAVKWRKGEAVSWHKLHPCWSCTKLRGYIKGRQKQAVFVNPRVNAVGSAYPEGLNSKELTHVLTRHITARLGSYSLYFRSG